MGDTSSDIWNCDNIFLTPSDMAQTLKVRLCVKESLNKEASTRNLVMKNPFKVWFGTWTGEQVAYPVDLTSNVRHVLQPNDSRTT